MRIQVAPKLLPKSAAPPKEPVPAPRTSLTQTAAGAEARDGFQPTSLPVRYSVLLLLASNTETAGDGFACFEVAARSGAELAAMLHGEVALSARDSRPQKRAAYAQDAAASAGATAEAHPNICYEISAFPL